MSASVIPSLAILMVNWEKKQTDYLTGFEPMVKETLRSYPDDIIATGNLQAHFEERFGFAIPQTILKKLLNRLHRQSYVNITDDRTYTPNRKKLKSLDFDKTRTDMISQYKHLIEDLTSYANQFNLGWSIKDAEQAFEAFISDNQIALLANNYSKRIITYADYPARSAKYVVGSYINLIEKSEDLEFKYLVQITKGNFLANALFLPEQRRLAKKWETHIYFDTPFLIHLLGYSISPFVTTSQELHQALRQTTARLRCFRHNVDEVRGSFERCYHFILNRTTDSARFPITETLEYFKRNQYGLADIMILVDDLEDKLRELNISIVDKPTGNHLSSDEVAFSEHLKASFGAKNRQQNDDQSLSLQNDIDSILSIRRLRAGKKYRYIEQCKAVFITANKKLIQSSQEFFDEKQFADRVPLAMTDDALMNLVWLSQPTKLPNLPRKKLIADCYAAMQPDEYLWKLYLDKMQTLYERKTLTEKQYYYFRYSTDVRSAVMEYTLGDSDIIDGNTPEDIYKAVRDRTHKDISLERDILDEELRKQNNYQTRVRQKQEEKAQTWAKTTIIILRVIISIPIIITTILYAFGSYPQVATDNSINVLPLIMAIIFAIISSLSLIDGTPIKNWFTKREKDLSSRYLHFIQRMAGMEPSDENQD